MPTRPPRSGSRHVPSVAVNRASPLPLFYQVAESLKLALNEDAYGVGSRFFTVREVVDNYGVSFVTAQRALAGLAREGLIRSERGRGTTVLKKPEAAPADASARLPTPPLPVTRRVVILWPTRQPMASAFQTQISPILDGLRSSIPGYAISLEFTDELLLEESGQAYLDELLSAVGNTAFCLISVPAYVKRFFAQRQASAVVLGHVEKGIRLSSVSSNEERAIHDLTQHLIDLGHRQIVHVVGMPRVAGHEHRVRGFRRVLSRLGKSDADLASSELTVPQDRDRANDQLGRLLRQAKVPTAVICAGPVLAGWVRTVMGEQVHVAYDVHSEPHGPPMPHSTILIWPGEEFGYEAGTLLQQQIGGDRSTRERVLDYLAIRDH